MEGNSTSHRCCHIAFFIIFSSVSDGLLAGIAAGMELNQLRLIWIMFIHVNGYGLSGNMEFNVCLLRKSAFDCTAVYTVDG